MAAAGRANASRAIPIRRPDEASVPSSPRPEVAPAVVINANSEPVDTEAIQNKLKGLSVASAPPFVPKQSSSTVKGLNAASADFNPNSRPFTPPSQPRTSQLQPTAPDFTFSTSDSNTSGQPDFQPQLSPFEDAGLSQQGPTTLGTQDMFNPYADPIPQDAVDPSQNYYDPGLNRPEPYMQRAPVYYHLYQLPLPHVSKHSRHQIAINAFFISPTLREDLQKRAEALVPVDGTDIPGYFSLIALDTPTNPSTASSMPQQQQAQQSGTGIFGCRNWVYKAIAEEDGRPYVIRRLENFKLLNDQALSVIERWRKVKHPNLVAVRKAFTTRAFGDPSVVFVYDIHPLSKTLYDEHLSPMAQSHARSNMLSQLPERVLWSYAIQLANVLTTIHANKLAARTVEVTKILITGQHRVRLNGCGMLDVIHCDINDDDTLFRLQQADLFNLGEVLFALAGGSVNATSRDPQYYELIASTYSADFCSLLSFLISKPQPNKTVKQVLQFAGTRLFDELSAAHSQSDILESEMMREIENSRLVRLLCKFGFINERPEFDHDPRWAESGDRYLIKLFRDFVFHQVDERGRPVLDLSHVLLCLNKLDAGVEDKVMLVSRDSQNCLIVSYREIKNCVEAAYRDLAR